MTKQVQLTYYDSVTTFLQKGLLLKGDSAYSENARDILASLYPMLVEHEGSLWEVSGPNTEKFFDGNKSQELVIQKVKRLFGNCEVKVTFHRRKSS